jgi:ATP-dependent DNA helicase RecG
MNIALHSGSDISELKGIGPRKREAYEKLGIRTLNDLLSHFPREYQDYRSRKTISSLQDGEKALVQARALLIRKGKGYGRNRTLRLLAEDKTGRMEVLFFMGGYMENAFVQGNEYFFYGKVKNEAGRVTMLHPVFGSAQEAESAGILPVYPLTKGVTQKELRKHIKTALLTLAPIEESLPESILRKKNLCGLDYALANIHFPGDERKFQEARYRLIYEELFYMQTALLLSRNRFGKGTEGISFSRSVKGEDFIRGLPYPLTSAQKRVWADVEEDMESARAMNRLVQGDVGSGKTVIAQAALYKAVKSGFQAAFMAPTELLAKQHLEALSVDFAAHGINVGLLTGSLSSKEKKTVLDRLKNGGLDIAVGTHAILSEGVDFFNLGLVITDEQHRFGVNQRLRLSRKGENPDVLVMTATPIPRTLAVVLYGDLDISIIDEMPPGRLPVETKKFNEEERDKAYEILASEISKGRQAYIVAPLIEDSEEIQGRSAQNLFVEMKERFPDVRSSCLHGEMKQQEKDAIMGGFYSGEIQALVSTVVIEVGINVPNATVMLIENAERFGLAQLHQLRGRVGRGSRKSYCLIVTDSESEVAAARARTMCLTNDGFIIAEKDLELRGPGEIFGVRQHGLPELKLADPVKHIKVFEEARQDARVLLSEDFDLSKPENRCFSAGIKQRFDAVDSLVI